MGKKKTIIAKTELLDLNHIDSLYKKAVFYIDQARSNIQRTVDTEMVKAYWFIGKEIVEEEQKGQARAEYGTYLLKELSVRLNKKYGKGFSISTLKDIRQFYVTYSAQISHAPRGQSIPLSPNLGWIHYRALMRVGRKEARQFYEIEAEKNNCRSFASLLFKDVVK